LHQIDEGEIGLWGYEVDSLDRSEPFLDGTLDVGIHVHGKNYADGFVVLDDVAQSFTKKFQVGSVVFPSMLCNENEIAIVKNAVVEANVGWRSSLKCRQAKEQSIDSGIACNENPLWRYSFI
jgi:hypothetical protein